jgi:hypothetical protein
MLSHVFTPDCIQFTVPLTLFFIMHALLRECLLIFELQVPPQLGPCLGATFRDLSKLILGT